MPFTLELEKIAIVPVYTRVKTVEVGLVYSINKKVKIGPIKTIIIKCRY